MSQLCCFCCVKKPPGCVDISQAKSDKSEAPVVAPVQEDIEEPKQKLVQEEAQVPGIVEADDRLPVLDWPDGDSAGLQLFELLGRGASGCRVHRCKVGDQVLAAKVLPLGPATFPDMVEDLEKEVAVLKTIGEHPSLVSFYGAWKTARFNLDKQEVKAYVLGIELCDKNLEEVLQQRKEELPKALEEPELLAVLKQVSSALVHLHGHRVMHRDLKAGNVFLCRDSKDSGEPWLLTESVAKLGDFGVAKVCSRAQTPVQTPHFMAPEVAKQSEYGPAADIWAFGCLMLQMIDLDLPHGEDLTLPQLEEALLQGLPQLSQRDEAVARCPRVVAVMDRCLQKDPTTRPTAEQVHKELAEAVP